MTVDAEHGCHEVISLPLAFKLIVMCAHISAYPIIFFGILQLIKRQSDFYKFGNYKITILAFLFEWATVDYFICDHINTDWFVGPLSNETNVIHCIGSTCVVAGNAMLSLSLYPTHRGNLEPLLTWGLNILLIVCIILEPILFWIHRVIALLLLIISGVIGGYRILHTFGSSVKYFAIGYMAAGAVGGTCTLILVLDCYQIIHIFEASMFVVASLMFGLSLKFFDASYNPNNNNNNNKNKKSKNNNNNNNNNNNDNNNSIKIDNIGRLRSIEDSNSNSNDSNGKEKNNIDITVV